MLAHFLSHKHTHPCNHPISLSLLPSFPHLCLLLELGQVDLVRINVAVSAHGSPPGPAAADGHAVRVDVGGDARHDGGGAGGAIVCVLVRGLKEGEGGGVEG